ncbi:MAG: hypothetical protein IE926_03310 [Micrococcales bacterium]|nr:hypothetical protein [Micrococcales bacterium]
MDEACFAPVRHPHVPDVYIGAAENVAVTTTADDTDLTRALQAAANRLTLVDGDGVEHPDVDTMLREAIDLHTPSWAGVVTIEDRPTLSVDSDGVIPEPMGATMRAILRDELTRHLPDATARPL